MSGNDLSANPLYADLFQQAHDRIQEKNPSRNGMAEAVVSTYFEEILNAVIPWFYHENIKILVRCRTDFGPVC